MKCIKNKQTSEIKRVSNEAANRRVQTGDWNYCPKQEWKQNRK